MNKSTLTTIFLLGLFLFSACKESHTIIHPTTHDTNQVDSLYRLASKVINTEPNKAVEFGIQMLAKAEGLNYTEGIAKAHRVLGSAFDYSGRYDSSIMHYLEDIQLRQEIDDEFGVAQAYNSLAEVHHVIGLYSEAISYYQNALIIHQKLDNQKEIAKVMYHLGRVYVESKSFNSAERCYNRSLRIFKKLNDAEHVGQVYNDIGLLQEIRLDSSKATTADYSTILNFYLGSLKVQQQIGSTTSIGWACFHVGRIYNRLKRPIEAIQYLSRARKILEVTGDQAILLIALNESSEALILMRDGKKALELLQQAESLQNSLVGPPNEVSTDRYSLFQKVYAILDNPDKVAYYKEKQLKNENTLKAIREKDRVHQLEYQVLAKKVQYNILENKATSEKTQRSYFQFATILLAIGLTVTGYFFYKMRTVLQQYRAFSKILLGQ